MKKKYQKFHQFYPFYLSQHKNVTCRRLHFTGSLSVLALTSYVILTASYLWLCLLPVLGYGFAWFGHFIFEKNKPATFTYPLYSFIADWLMFKDMLTGKIKW